MLREELLNGLHDSVEAMSKALQTSNGYITSRIRLTFLSPKLIRNILNGEVPNALTPTKLLEGSKDLPTKWSEQDRFIATLARKSQPHKYPKYPNASQPLAQNRPSETPAINSPECHQNAVSECGWYV